MRIAVFRDEKHSAVNPLKLYAYDGTEEFSPLFLGYIDLPVEKPKSDMPIGYCELNIGRVTEDLRKMAIALDNYFKSRVIEYQAKPKKTVVKEASCISVKGADNIFRFDEYKYLTPTNAKDIKCTYEVEE